MNSPLNAPLLVLDLDGTLADTAADLIGTLNVILAREGHAPLPLDSARELVGAGRIYWLNPYSYRRTTV